MGLENKILWFVNFTEIPNTGHTTAVKLFSTLTASRLFMSDKYGYIIRQDKNCLNKLYEKINGFIPSAGESQKIKSL